MREITAEKARYFGHIWLAGVYENESVFIVRLRFVVYSVRLLRYKVENWRVELCEVCVEFRAARSKEKLRVYFSWYNKQQLFKVIVLSLE